MYILQNHFCGKVHSVLRNLKTFSMSFIWPSLSLHKQEYLSNDKHYIRIIIKDHLLVHHKFLGKIATFSIKLKRPCEIYAAYISDVTSSDTF